MPLHDHFRPPLDDVHSWDELHGMWPTLIVLHLQKILPEPYYAAPGVHLGNRYEVDIGAYRLKVPDFANEEPISAVATYSPPQPTLTLEPELPSQDVYEVRIYDSRRQRRLVAAIEIVSPSNKDRPDSRLQFVSKVANLLKNNVCVSIVDVVGTIDFNLYGELMEYVNRVDPALGDSPATNYAATLRTRYDGFRKMMDNWYHPLAYGQPLPTLPIWLQESFAISLDLEASYDDVCRTLRIR
jgi:Protein of unknown function (DUF4058)